MKKGNEGKSGSVGNAGHGTAPQDLENAHTTAEKDREKPHEKEIEELKKIAADYKETLQRMQAEFENADKRLEREKEEFVKFAAFMAITKFLPIADSIEEGMKEAEKTGNSAMKEGFEKLQKQFMQALEMNGVKRIESVGKKFDHEMHEVLMTAKEESKEDGIVLEEFHKGYMMNGRVLRPAKVKVNKKEETITK
ncbi:MAG: nucleotide exchange factor GrpE [Candidatus Diapherotrites archaeon]|uniref:Protein GrpE n=1 Tax=Candidatus Iainarchaeum sp. TaxID=3101447 RepID=A0A8T3YLS7_9ARCH|nr:nucleotide exchange factor GrpE [Candidatus Diapherotrites archaeon]